MCERTTHALRCGALRPIPTDREVLRQDGIDFVVRVVANLKWKAQTSAGQRRNGSDPFAPYDPDLFVADLSDTHVCLLNKFNVLEHHVLVVPRVFEEQESLITRRDFEAMWLCMAEFEALAFYNAGSRAGASQRHKHLQLVSVPLGVGPEPTPIDAVIEAATFEGGVGQAPGLPFVHALARTRSLRSKPRTRRS